MPIYFKLNFISRETYFELNTQDLHLLDILIYDVRPIGFHFHFHKPQFDEISQA